MSEIALLAEALDSAVEPRAVLVEFAASNTFPLVDGRTATFFFWDPDHPPTGVQLLHWVHGLESHQPFLRLGDHDAWFLRLDLPLNSRVEYKLLVERGGQSELIRDPRNPRQAFDPFGSNSVLPMTGYTDPPWSHHEPFVRQGRLERFRFRSEVYGDVREVAVYVPAEYRRRKRYPLLVCHDGEDYLKFASMGEVLDNLIHRREVAPILVAFTRGVSRNEEYAANPLQASFLVDELIPAVKERFSVDPDPDTLGVMGASFGGVSSLYAAWTHPGTFGRLFLQSGSFVFTEVGHHGRSALWDPVVSFVNTFREDPARIDAKVFMSCGTFEGLIYYNRSLAPLMRRAGLQVRMEESRDGHNWIAWRDHLRDGLAWLYPGHLWMTYD